MLRRFLGFLLLAVLCTSMSLQSGRSGREGTNFRNVAGLQATQPRDADLILIPAGTVQIGDYAGPPDELPAFHYASRAFLMDRTPVTVAQFAAFVKDTSYRTDAERYGSGGVLDQRQGQWVPIDAANWRNPEGPREKSAQRIIPLRK